MMDYSQIDGLSLFYFEDSWVLDVVARPGLLTLDLDAVLLPAHPEHVAPSPGEQYCYRRGELRFEGVADLQWIGQGLPPARDGTGESDYGSIDSFALGDGRYRISGNFGDIVARATSVRMLLLGKN